MHAQSAEAQEVISAQDSPATLATPWPQVDGFVAAIEDLMPHDTKARRREDSLTAVRLGGSVP